MTTGPEGYTSKAPGAAGVLNNEQYKEKVLTNLSKFIAATEISEHKNRPPQQFLDEPILRQELIRKLPKNFPFDQFELNELLGILARRRIFN